MRVKRAVAGAALVGIAAVVSYVNNSRPNTDSGVVIGLITVNALVILAVLVVALFVRRSGVRP